MRTISKKSEPSSLGAWKQANPQGGYNELTSDIPPIIRQSALEEQYYLCAYCCQQIPDINSCHNEHVEAQSRNPKRSLDFTNIVASCNTPNQCGRAHKSQDLPLTPLLPECEIELRFKISGRVEGLSDRAINTIHVLNLGDSEKNNRALIEKRKQLSNALLLTHYGDLSQGLEEDEEILTLLIDELTQPQDGKLKPFAPVVVNIVRTWTQS